MIHSTTSSSPMLIAMIIDRSGSMASITDATISGFNEYLQDRKRENPDAVMSLTLFNTELEQRFTAEKVTQIPEFNAKTYVPGGGTALNDAIAVTIKQIEAAHYDKLARILVTIITDGQENSSKQFSREDVAQLISAKEEAGWKFVYFGANVDVQVEARSRNFHPSRMHAWAPTDAGTATAYMRLSNATRSFSSGAPDEAWTAELREEIVAPDA